MAERYRNAKWAGIALLCGSLAGAGTALMFAPMSGKRTRQWLADTAQDAKCRAESYGRMARGKVASGVQRIKIW